MTDKQARILIVDDEEFNREIIIDYLEDGDYTLSTAADGAIAWAMLEAEPDAYDVVLLDRMMPNMDGMEVLARIKAHPILKHIPVILQTARVATQDILDGIQAGAYYYLTKPFEADLLFSVVGTAVRDSWQYQALQRQMRETTGSLGLMRQGTFMFRDCAEGKALAALLANACPNPGRVVLGLSELMINAVEHGNLGIGYDEKTQLNELGGWAQEVDRRLALEEFRDKLVEVEFSCDDEAISILIRDQGKGFEWQKFLHMSPERAMDNHGRGIAMAGMLSFDRLEYLGVGNEVKVHVDLDES